MCGIVGMALKYGQGLRVKEETAFFDMLYADAVRGWDSTGVIGVEKDGSFHIAKEATQATSFIDDYRAAKHYKSFSACTHAMIGHNRKKTMGKVADATSHPFVVDKTFAMVHNGTLYNHEALAKTDVDSEALAIVLKKAFDKPIAERKEALEETLGTVYGAYAVAIYNQKDNQIYLLRNKERPLSIVEVNGSWWWGSEAPLVHWCLWRNGFEGKEMKTVHCEEHMLYTIDLDTHLMTQEQLTPKKYMPSVGALNPTGGNTGKKGTTKNKEFNPAGFQPFREHNLNKVIRFYIEDFVEEDYPNTVAQGSTSLLVFGSNDDWNFFHTISGVMDIAGTEFVNDVSKIDNGPFYGTIEEITYSSETGQIIVEVADIKSPPPSINVSAAATVFGPEQLKTRMDYAEQLNSWTDAELRLKLHDKDMLANWQVMAIGKEINARKLMKSYENTTALH